MVRMAGHTYICCTIVVYYISKLAITLPEVGPNAFNTKKQTCGKYGVQEWFNPARNCFIRCESKYGQCSCTLECNRAFVACYSPCQGRAFSCLNNRAWQTEYKECKSGWRSSTIFRESNTHILKQNRSMWAMSTEGPLGKEWIAYDRCWRGGNGKMTLQKLVLSVVISYLSRTSNWCSTLRASIWVTLGT